MGSAVRQGQAELRLRARVADLTALGCHAVTGCDAASVVVTRRPDSLLVLGGSGAGGAALDHAQVLTGHGPAAVAAEQDVPVLVRDHAGDGRWPEVDRAAVLAGVRSTLCLPLRRADRAVGALCLHARRADAFGEHSQRVGRALAREVAAALEDAARLRDHALTAGEESRIARALQRALHPVAASLPGAVAAGRHLTVDPGASVGGDWYDLFALTDREIGLAVGDVMGHDIEAAATMGRYRSALRSYAYEGGAPSAVMDRLDRFARGFDMTLTTAVYGTLVPQPTGSLLMFCSAGHLPPLVREPGGHVVTLTDGSSWLLGAPWTRLGPRQDGVRWLPSGSSLVLYTDGLVERPGRDLDQGLERLRRSLADVADDDGPEQVCERLLVDLDGQGLLDDLALLVVRVE